MNRILIPLDGSEFSTQIIAGVKKFFPAGACELVLYHVGARTDGHTGLPPRPAAPVVDVPMYESDKDAEFAQHPIYESQEDDTRVAAWRDELSPLAQALQGLGYSVKVEADLGHAADAIIERTRANDIDLIAMTTHGRSGITRLLFGSVAEQVVRHTAVPVLLIRPTPPPQEELAPDA